MAAASFLQLQHRQPRLLQLHQHLSRFKGAQAKSGSCSAAGRSAPLPAGRCGAALCPGNGGANRHPPPDSLQAQVGHRLCPLARSTIPDPSTDRCPKATADIGCASSNRAVNPRQSSSCRSTNIARSITPGVVGAWVTSASAAARASVHCCCWIRPSSS